MHAAAPTFDHAYRPRLSKAGLGVVAAIHVALLAALVQFNMIPLPAPLAVLSVSLLPPAPEAIPQPEIVPPKPRPIERRPTPVPPPVPTQLAAPADAPAPSPVAVAPAPTLVAPAPIAAPPAPAAPTPPRFDADYLDNPRPAYPAISRRLGEQGRVMLRVHVDADGRPTEVQLHAPSGSPRLDQVALDTVRRWKFVAARLGQQPVAAWVLVPIAFTLKD
ncbi:MAG: energy transducer TonB [Rhodocyclales bacterium]|nr:energy transducer TonB [Rhodocyclales bacterium]